MTPRATPPDAPAPLRAERGPLAAIVAVSVVAVAGIGWLLLAHRGHPEAARRVAFLPAVNASLNATAAALLVLGVRAIRAGHRARHRALMLGAFAASSVFLVGYLTWHALHGDTKYPPGAPLRALYLAILASHVLLSIVALPLCLATLWLALRDRVETHRRLARVTFPIWLYVSVTGVLVFAMLRAATG